MKIKVIIHEAEEGGYWAEVPTLPGCITEGDTWDELIANIKEVVEGCLEVIAERQDNSKFRLPRLHLAMTLFKIRVLQEINDPFNRNRSLAII